jgi:hypothetical protein
VRNYSSASSEIVNLMLIQVKKNNLRVVGIASNVFFTHQSLSEFR